LAGARANYHCTRVDPDASRKLRVPSLLVELRDRIEDCKARACGALGVAVMRLGPTEIRHQTVAEILRHTIIEAGNRFGGYPTVIRDGLTAGVGTELLGHGEIIEVTRSSPSFQCSPVPMSRAHRHDTRAICATPRRVPQNLRLVGG
jgi:hypothetical protein